MWTISNTNMQSSQSLLINKSSCMFNPFTRLLDSILYIVSVSIYTSQLYQVSKLTTFLFNCIVDTDVKDLITSTTYNCSKQIADIIVCFSNNWTNVWFLLKLTLVPFNPSLETKIRLGQRCQNRWWWTLFYFLFSFLF